MTEEILYSMKIPDLLSKIEEIINKRLETLKPQKEETFEYITRKEVADLLKITLPTLRDWTRLGWLKSYKIGTRVLYKRKEVEAAIEGLLEHKNKKGGMR